MNPRSGTLTPDGTLRYTSAPPPAARSAPVVHYFTVDLEDWRHSLQFDRPRQSALEDRVPRGMEPMLELLAEHGVTATVFVLGRVAARHPGLVRRIAEAGHEIASHGWSHDPLYTMDRARFAEETHRATGTIAELTGVRPTTYRAAYFSITRDSLWALETLVEQGYTHDSSIIPVHNWRYGIPGSPSDPYVVRTPSGPLCEIPISTRSFFGTRVPTTGGAYLRLYPYAFTRANMRHAERASRPVVFYIHPWEIDPGVPRVPLPWKQSLPRYANLASTVPKLRRLLRDFHFGPLRRFTDSWKP